MALQARRDAHVRLHGCQNLALAVYKLNSAVDERADAIPVNKNAALHDMASFKLEKSAVEAYRLAFENWKRAVDSRQDCESFDIIASTRVLLGTGNASVFEFGFNLNYPWGIPYIAGSTLKGAVSSYLARHGGQDWSRTKGAQKSDAQVELFGGILDRDGKSYSGLLTFHDAWLCPWQHRDTKGDWFDEDIINPHYPEYYRGNRLPDGTDNPIPIKIAALCPGLRFLVTIQGPEDYRKLAKSVLVQLLEEEGIGGKTAVGYGRFTYVKSVEENLEDAKRQIVEIDTPEMMQKKFDEFRNEKKLHKDLREALGRLPYSQDIQGIWQSLHPLGLLEQLMRQGVFTKFKDLNARFKDFYTGITKWMESEGVHNLSSTTAGQNLFRLMLEKWPEDVAKNVETIIVKELAFTWADMNLTAETLLGMIETRSFTWPPSADLRDFVENSGRYTGDDLELLLMALDEAAL